ncbi:MAG: hypothetical protein NC339_04785 [Muribaculaceae bacterium]|nr:hypothetical protein [Muribaculaceae bacterium]
MDSKIIAELVASGKLEEAVAALSGMIDANPHCDTLYFERGKLKWRMGDRSGATSDYMKAVSLNPDSPARRALEQAQDVADFFNPDLYNP